MDERTVRYTNREDPARYYGVELSPERATFVAGGDVLAAAVDARDGDHVATEEYPLSAAGLDGDRVTGFIDDLETAVPGRHVWYDGKPRGPCIVDLPYREAPEKTPVNEADRSYAAALDAVSRTLGGRSEHPAVALGALPFQWRD